MVLKDDDAKPQKGDAATEPETQRQVIVIRFSVVIF